MRGRKPSLRLPFAGHARTLSPARQCVSARLVFFSSSKEREPQRQARPGASPGLSTLIQGGIRLWLSDALQTRDGGGALGRCIGKGARPFSGGAPSRFDRTGARRKKTDSLSRSPPLQYSQYKVKDITQADFGRLEIELAEAEMPGLMSSREEFGPSQPFKVREHRERKPKKKAPTPLFFLHARPPLIRGVGGPI